MSSANKKWISQIVFDRKFDEHDMPRRHGKKRWVLLNVRHPGTRIAFQPPVGIDVAVWISVISTLIAARGGLIFAANVLANIFSWAVPVLNQVLGGPFVLFPDPQLLLEFVTRGGLDLWAYKPDYAKALATVLQAMAQACPAFSAFSGIDMERDIISQGKSCVIEIPTMNPPWIRLLLIDILIAQILYGRIHRHQKMDRTDVIIYLDEADADLSTIASDAAFADMYSILAQLLRMGREYGIMVVVGVGVLGNISRFVSSSFQDLFILNVSGGEQSAEAQRILQLPPGAEQMCKSLKPGQCLFLENQGAWPHAVWAQVDYLAPDRSTEPVEYDTLPSIVPSRPLSEMPGVEEALKKRIDDYNRRKLERHQAKAGTLGKHAANLFHTTIPHPWVPVARLWEMAGTVPSPPAQKTAQRQLENHGLAKFALLRAGKRNCLLIELTDTGYRAAGQEPPIRTRSGSRRRRLKTETGRTVGTDRQAADHQPTPWSAADEPASHQPARRKIRDLRGRQEGAEGTADGRRQVDAVVVERLHEREDAAMDDVRHPDSPSAAIEGLKGQCLPSSERLLLKADEAAHLLGISRGHFYSLHSSARVPYPIRLGRCVRWRAEELREWVRAGCPPRHKWAEMQEDKGPRR